ncbi:MAG: hypothetical protein GWN00_20675, partial [Aliifodinibius sp.]|nr:hypothetical protein [Fodinibius sp.]NIY27136.1 hypothetical protein [Fodinibius sp.]
KSTMTVTGEPVGDPFQAPLYNIGTRQEFEQGIQDYIAPVNRFILGVAPLIGNYEEAQEAQRTEELARNALAQGQYGPALGYGLQSMFSTAGAAPIIGGAVRGMKRGAKALEKGIESIYKIKKPKLSSDEISSLARDIDEGWPADKIISRLKEKGKKHIDGYQVSAIGTRDAKKYGLERGGEWYGREPAVYFFADPDDIEHAIPYLAMKIEGDKGGDVLVNHFRIPVEDIKDMKWDGFFNVQFETYSGFSIPKDIPPSQVVETKRFKIPSAKEYNSQFEPVKKVD